MKLGCYLLNIIADLKRIQSGFKTKFFAPNLRLESCSYFWKEETLYHYPNLSSVSQERLLEIDNKLGYTENGLYMNYYIDIIKKLLSDKTMLTMYINKNQSRFQDTNDCLLKSCFDFLLDYAQTLNPDLKNVRFFRTMLLFKQTN